MDSLEEKINGFFIAYERRFNNVLHGEQPDIDGIINSFGEFFVESSPVGVNGGKNDQEFREAIPKGYEFYKSIGNKSMHISSTKLTKLDEYHCMVKVHWISEYQAVKKIKTIEFDITYFLFCADGPLKIFAYITGEEQKALRDNGLISFRT